MKKFFTVFLGSMAALWLSLLIVTVGLIIVFAAAAGSSSAEKQVSVKKHSYLTLNLSDPIDDRDGQFSPIEFVRGNKEISTGLGTVVASIEAAADDDNIDGIVIEGSSLGLGLAQLQAVGEALAKFKEKAPDKWIYAYGETVNLSEYYLSSYADSIYLNPSGMVDVHGIGQGVMFFKDFLDKLGVEVQVMKVGTYKSAVEPFILNSMSEPAREQARLYLDNMWGYLAGTIAKGRNVPVDSVNAWAESYLATISPERYIDMKVVDGLMYRHEFDEKLVALTDVKKVDDLRGVTPRAYAKGRDLLKKGSGKGAKIGILYACGDITDEEGEGIVAAKLVPEILDLAEDDDLDGLIMYVNSPGGSAYASEQIWEALQQWKKITGKPLYVSMSDYAASGGYYISCGADKIFAQPSTLTGSIGIFGMIPNAQPLMNKLGIHVSTVSSAKTPQSLTLLEPMSPGLRNAMQTYVERGYDLFTRRCAEGRGMSQDSIKAIAEGRVWDGAEALRIGLVDELGGLDKAIAAMAQELNVETWTISEYPDKNDKWYDELIKATSEMKASWVRDELGEMAPVYDRLNSIRRMSVLQARSEIYEIQY